MIHLELSADECSMLGEALAGQCVHYEHVLKALRAPPNCTPSTADYIESKLRAIRNLHVTIINARTEAVQDASERSQDGPEHDEATLTPR